MKESFVFDFVVGGVKVNLKHITESVAFRGHQDHSGPRAMEHLGAINEHRQVLGDTRDGLLLLNPLAKEIYLGLRLDGFLSFKLDVQRKELDGPLCHSICDISVVHDVRQRGVTYHRDRVFLKVMCHLLCCYIDPIY